MNEARRATPDSSWLCAVTTCLADNVLPYPPCTSLTCTSNAASKRWSLPSFVGAHSTSVIHTCSSQHHRLFLAASSTRSHRPTPNRLQGDMVPPTQHVCLFLPLALPHRQRTAQVIHGLPLSSCFAPEKEGCNWLVCLMLMLRAVRVTKLRQRDNAAAACCAELLYKCTGLAEVGW